MIIESVSIISRSWDENLRINFLNWEFVGVYVSNYRCAWVCTASLCWRL